MGNGSCTMLFNKNSNGYTAWFSTSKGGESAGTIAYGGSSSYGGESAGTVAHSYSGGGSSSSGGGGGSFSAIC